MAVRYYLENPQDYESQREDRDKRSRKVIDGVEIVRARDADPSVDAIWDPVWHQVWEEVQGRRESMYLANTAGHAFVEGVLVVRVKSRSRDAIRRAADALRVPLTEAVRRVSGGGGETGVRFVGEAE